MILSICSEPKILEIMRIVNIFINIIQIVVPILLIFTLIFKFIKATINDDQDNLQKVLKTVPSNLIAAVIIFLVPYLVSMVVKVSFPNDDYKNCLNVKTVEQLNKIYEDRIEKLISKAEETLNINDYTNAINYLKNIKDEDLRKTYEDKLNVLKEQIYTAPTITSIINTGAFVVVNVKRGTNNAAITGYYFGKTDVIPDLSDSTWINKNDEKLEIAKMPGTYYVYVKDASNKISDPQTLTITFEDLYNNGPHSRLYKGSTSTASELTIELSKYLAEKNDSIDNFNDFIFQSVKSAGIFTKDGVATAAAASIYYLYAKYNIQVPYISNVSCATTRYLVEFGANPDWGKFIASPNSERATYCKGTNLGLDCQSFVGWAIHNGGFKAENTAGSYSGTYKTYCRGNNCNYKSEAYQMYDSLTIGDIIYSDAHKMLVIGHYDENNDGKNDGMYVFEQASPLGISKFSYEWLYSNGNTGAYKEAMLMEKYYSNRENYACLKGNNGQSVNIPNLWYEYSSYFRNNCVATN